MPLYTRTNNGNDIAEVGKPIEAAVPAFTSGRDYHSDYESVSKTMLNRFFDSPVEYQLTYITRELPTRRPSKFMLEGTVTHEVLLKRRQFDDVVLVYPDTCLKSNGDLNGKPAAQFRLDNPESICLKQDAVDRLQALVTSLQGSPLMKAVDESVNMEKRHDAILYGLKSRCMPDIVGELDECVPIYDLKFCSRIAHPVWNRLANRLRYWLQDVHYSLICEAVYSKPVRFRFFAIEGSYPFRVQSYWYTDRAREIGKQSHANKMYELSECMEKDQWKDRWQNELSLESYDIDEQDQLVEFGEEVEA